MNKKEFEYYAFISYSRKDLQDAKWFQKNLEKFHIPTKLPRLPNEKPLPKHLKVFRDKTDLEISNNSFKEDLIEAIKNSQYLIVLCSPNAAKSTSDFKHYIDWEIEEFISLHGKEYALTHILPVVIDGKVNSGDPVTECMPPNLLSLGDDFLEHNFPVYERSNEKLEQKKNKNELVLKSLSFLLNVKYSVLNDRFQQEQRKQMKMFLTVATVIVVLLSGLSIWALTEQKNARNTLAQADFQEASRLLDNNESSMALAYFAQSLSENNNPAVFQRLYNTLTKNSWLVERNYNNDSKISTSKNVKYFNDLDISSTVKFQFYENTNYDVIISKDGSIFSLVLKTSSEDIFTEKIKDGFGWSNFLISEDDRYFVSVQEYHYDLYKDISLSDLPKEYLVIKVFDIVNKKTVKTYIEESPIHDLDLSPDGAFFAYTIMNGTKGEDYTLKVKSITGVADDWSIHLTDCRRILFSPDAITLMVNAETEIPGKINFYDAYQNGKLLSTTVLNSSINLFSFSHDGRKFVFATNNQEIGIINVRDGKEDVKRKSFDTQLVSIEFSDNDSSIILGTKENKKEFVIQASPLKDMEIQLGCCLKAIPVVNGSKVATICCQQGKYYLNMVGISNIKSDILSYEFDKEASNKINNADSKLCFDVLPNCGSFSQDNKYIALGFGNLTSKTDSGFIELYQITNNINNSNQWKNSCEKIECSFPIQYLSFSPDGTKIIAYSNISSRTDTINAILYDINSKRKINLYHEDNIVSAQFISSEKIITLGLDKTIKCWSTQNGSNIWSTTFKISDGFPSCMAVSSQGVIACGTRLLNSNGNLVLLTTQGKIIREDISLVSGVKKLLFNKNGNMLAVAYKNGVIQVQDTKSGKPRSRYLVQGKSTGGEITSIGFYNDGKKDYLCSSGKNSDGTGFTECWWDISTSQRLEDTGDFAKPVKDMWTYDNGTSIAWSDDKLIVSTYSPVHEKINSNDFVKLIEPLSNLKLNEWRIPEYVDTKYDSSLAGKNLLNKSIKWLNDFSDERTISPTSTTKEIDHLASFDKSKLDNLEFQLDVKPDYEEALNEYWFRAVYSLMENKFQKNAVGRSANKTLENELEWSNNTQNFWSYFVKDPEAVRLADFLTNNFIAKCPTSGLAWYNRSKLYWYIGKLAESEELLNKAIELDPTNTNFVLARISNFCKNTQEKDDLLNNLKSTLEKKEDVSISEIFNFGEELINNQTSESIKTELPKNLNWIVSQVKKVKGKADVNEELLSLSIRSGQLLEHIICIPDGANQLSIFLQSLIDIYSNEKDVSEFNRLNFKCYIAFCKLVSGDYNSSETIYNDIQTTIDNSKDILLKNNLLSCLKNKAFIESYKGDNKKAAEYLSQALNYDSNCVGTISSSILDNFHLFKLLGKPVPCEKLLKEQIIQIAKAYNQQGIVINSVIEGGQASNLGLKTGDVIMSYDEYPVFTNDNKTFVNILQTAKFRNEEKPCVLVVERNGKELKFMVKPGLLGVQL